ncbi:MAG: hypothetical protein ABEJ61_01340 [Haloferacaceae archaeon]
MGSLTQGNQSARRSGEEREESARSPDADGDTANGSNGTVEAVASDDGGAEQAPARQLSLSEVFSLLSNTRRRWLLRILRDRDGTAVLGDVAEVIAARENDKEVESLTSRERKCVYVGLYQCHLPKLDDSGIVDFDKHRGTIELTEDAAALFEYLDHETDEERPWPRYYLALAGAWVGVLLLGQLASLSIVASPLVTAVLLLTFAVCGVAHYWDVSRTDEEPAVEAAA